MNTKGWSWHVQRLAKMSAGEVAFRAIDQIRLRNWSRRRGPDGTFPSVIANRVDGWRMRPSVGRDAFDDASTTVVVQAADRLLAGEWTVLGMPRADIAEPDWAADPTGARFPTTQDAFRIDVRSTRYGDVKQVWELSRHHHVSLLACAWHLTGDDRYADMAARHLRSWWADNPVLVGVNWSSGIELGVRLIAWAWTRRLLDGWPGAAPLFEGNPVALTQLYWHQRYLDACRSRGSSANNHLVAETAGLLVASCAFDWFAESGRWRRHALDRLARVLETNTFRSGVNREQASDYHAFVGELGLVATVEAASFGLFVPSATWTRLCAMADAGATMVDERLRPPRQGDSDDGRALVVSDPDKGRWEDFLSVGAGVFGPLDWWPRLAPRPMGSLVAGLLGRPVAVAGRPAQRPERFADAGLSILRARAAAPGQEVWCRCDGGPLGFGSLAAHGHAAALSIEVRCGGVDVLADPGTYCYHAHPNWRTYFRSTRAHNTVVVDGVDQSVPGGPFLWRRQAVTRQFEAEGRSPQVLSWAAEHDGYERLASPVLHRRLVTLCAETGRLRVLDTLVTSGPHDVELRFHLGPTVGVELDGPMASLRWARPDDHTATAVLALPETLEWSLHRGEIDPIEGWYSTRFGERSPAAVLVGRATTSGVELTTDLVFGASSAP